MIVRLYFIDDEDAIADIHEWPASAHPYKIANDLFITRQRYGYKKVQVEFVEDSTHG